MNGSIKPIETIYKGYRFRSRLEARWAVFFDALGVNWIYEPEGYNLGELGGYLPDFFFPKLNYFVEIKGQNATEIEECKCARLSDITKKDVFLFDSGVFLPDYHRGYPEAPYSHWYKQGYYRDWPAMWMKCDKCGSLDITFDGWVHYSEKCDCYTDPNRNKLGAHHQDILSAYTMALSARFDRTPKVV